MINERQTIHARMRAVEKEINAKKKKVEEKKKELSALECLTNAIKNLDVKLQ